MDGREHEGRWEDHLPLFEIGKACKICDSIVYFAYVDSALG